MFRFTAQGIAERRPLPFDLTVQRGQLLGRYNIHPLWKDKIHWIYIHFLLDVFHEENPDAH